MRPLAAKAQAETAIALLQSIGAFPYEERHLRRARHGSTPCRLFFPVYHGYSYLCCVVIATPSHLPTDSQFHAAFLYKHPLRLPSYTVASSFHEALYHSHTEIIISHHFYESAFWPLGPRRMRRFYPCKKKDIRHLNGFRFPRKRPLFPALSDAPQRG